MKMLACLQNESVATQHYVEELILTVVAHSCRLSDEVNADLLASAYVGGHLSLLTMDGKTVRNGFGFESQEYRHGSSDANMNKSSASWVKRTMKTQKFQSVSEALKMFAEKYHTQAPNFVDMITTMMQSVHSDKPSPLDKFNFPDAFYFLLTVFVPKIGEPKPVRGISLEFANFINRIGSFIHKVPGNLIAPGVDGEEALVLYISMLLLLGEVVPV